MNYQYLKDKPTRFESLTGYTLENLFFRTLPNRYYATKTRWKTAYKTSTYKSSLFILVYLGHKMCNSSGSTCCAQMDRLPVLNGALAELGELPSRETIPNF